MKNHVAVVGAALGAALLAACDSPPSRVRKGKVIETISQSPVQNSYVEAIGIGASDPDLPTETQRKSLARDAAIVKAQFEMLSMIKGVTLSGGVTVQRAMETDSTLEARIHETIRGAEILKSEFTSDSGCVVTIRLPKARLQEILGRH